MTYEFTVSSDPKSALSDRFRVELNAQEIAPSLVYEDGVLRTDYDNATWYVNGTKIEGISGNEFTPTASGSYEVEVANGSCVARSEILDVVLGNEFNSFFSMAPNPVQNMLTLRVYSQDMNELTFNVIDARGRIYMSNKTLAGQDSYQIDVSHLPAGVYIVKIVAGESIFAQRIIKK